ncbi:hypothetical protein HPB49_012785 [Dermacentor silvarum]|uniref:Uncharacterized protein n=1 Tax=Dermacentor silvarum TaxID=543639 RepID=A0ACB8DZQ7_DERSI|nr:hypothetical protein HPB49_012785 [Dermacentor silvarum]
MCGSVVEIRGDDMARFDWYFVRERLIQPCVDAHLRVFDKAIERLNQINYTVTLEATQAFKIHNVGVKRATITAENDVLEKYHLKRMCVSPNAAIHNTLGGTIFREPKVCRNIPPVVKQWCKPIVIARHAFDYQRNGKDFVVLGPGIQIKYSPAMGAPYNLDVIYYVAVRLLLLALAHAALPTIAECDLACPGSSKQSFGGRMEAYVLRILQEEACSTVDYPACGFAPLGYSPHCHLLDMPPYPVTTPKSNYAEHDGDTLAAPTSSSCLWRLHAR